MTKQSKSRTAQEILTNCKNLIGEKGKGYDGNQERSFTAVAQAYNAINNTGISGANIAEILLLVKLVRQANSEGYHLDSAEDAVSYCALMVEELENQLSEKDYQMRKIEQEMLTAVYNKQNWSSGNMQVNYIEEMDASFVALHSNNLGLFSHKTESFDVNEDTLIRYPTNVTTSRLRAFGVPVNIKKGIPYVNGEEVK